MTYSNQKRLPAYSSVDNPRLARLIEPLGKTLGMTVEEIDNTGMMEIEEMLRKKKGFRTRSPRVPRYGSDSHYSSRKQWYMRTLSERQIERRRARVRRFLRSLGRNSFPIPWK